MPTVGKKKKKPHYSNLWHAVFYNNVDMVETLLDGGVKVNEVCGKDRGTVLHLAAKKGLAEVVKLLLIKSADVKKIDRFGNTPLHVGASHEHVALELLNYNADVNAKNSFRETPLHHVSSAEVVRRMLAKKVYLDIRDRKGESALFKAITKGRGIHLLEALLTAGADVNKEYGNDSETVLHIAAKKGSTEIVKLLLKNGADVTKRDRFGNTPLHKGAWLESVALELIKYNADVNAINDSRETPLHHAVSVAVVESMIARGVDLDVLDINMETALYRATKAFCKWDPQYEYLIKGLITVGANVNQECGVDRETVLHLAAEKNLTEVVKLLLENGVDVNKRDRFDNTPLHRGARHEGVALELIKHNADVSAKNYLREMPIHFAGSAAVVRSMIARGVNVDVLDKNGETLLFRVTKPLCKDLLKGILNAGANVNQECGEDCETSLHIAAKLKSIDIVRLLLKNGADVNKRDRFGNTPLHRGASNKCVALELIKHNADINAKNIFKDTPLHYAGSKDIFNSMIVRAVKKTKGLPGSKRETARLREIESYSLFMQEALSTAEAKRDLGGEYGKTETVDDLVFKRVCIVNGMRKCVYFQGRKRAYPSLEYNREICESYVKFATFSCGQLSNILRLKRNGMNKSYTFSRRSKKIMAGLDNFTLEDEVKAWYDAKEDKTEEWHLAHDKKKFKKRETNNVEKKVCRKLKTRLNYISGYNNVIVKIKIDKISRHEEDYKFARSKKQNKAGHSRAANIEIRGLPITRGEDIYRCLEGIAHVLGVLYTREQISIAHRLRLYSKNHIHPPIIVQFVSRIVKESWLQAARRKKPFNAKKVSAALPSSAVYVDEHLTPRNKMLLCRARQLQREKKLHHVECSNGKVLVKRRNGDEAARVLVMKDFDKYD